MSGLFEHGYPYTDAHELNLSWVILKVKELAEAWAQVQQDWTDEQAAFANLQSWIENYFNNLNVQTEINVKLDAMVAAGTMSELIAPYVASGLPAEVAAQIGDVVATQIGPVVAAQIGAVVADQLPAVAAAAAATEVGTWLSTHIDPDTGYVIDDSLTVQGAAADAKAVGDEVTAIKSALSYNTNTFTYTGASNKQFAHRFDAGQSYLITNNLGVAFSPKCVDKNNNTVTVVDGLGNGKSYLFTPTVDYVSIGGFASSAGSFTVEGYGIINYAENLYWGENINIVNGTASTGTNPPTLTLSATRLRPDRFIRVRAGESVKITNGSFRHRFFGWYGKDLNTATLSITPDMSDEDALYNFTQDGYFIVLFFKNPESSVLPSAFDGSIKIGLANAKTIRVASYNTGGFEGTGYEQGSDALALEYRKAIGDTKANLFILQEDTPFFNRDAQSNPKDAIFAMFKYYTRNGLTDYNYKCFASDYPIYNRVAVDYATPDTNHYYFLVGEIVIDGITFTLVNLHLDWYDVTRRSNQIAEVITYLSGKKHVIIAGDMNPSVRVNGEFPEESSHNANYDHWEEDNALWTAAGYTVGNGGYFGAYQTDLTYPAPTDADCAAWDNVIVSSDIKIKNVGVTLANYMDDHAIFWADLEFESLT